MSLFDTIRYPVNDIRDYEEMKKIPREILLPWTKVLSDSIGYMSVDFKNLLTTEYHRKAWSAAIDVSIQNSTWNYTLRDNMGGSEYNKIKTLHFTALLRKMIADHDNI